MDAETSNKARVVGYWIATALFALAMLGSGAVNITNQPVIQEGMVHLGYPEYLPRILGAWKLLGVAALLAPGAPRLKEWAYAGFLFNLTGAAASHAFAGDALGQIASPLVLLSVALASWALRPASRKL
ncbi:MAG: DoxX family protein [Alphaproteobacteria bacterium]|nr:DoxX family protein [Alphaproteobacteria bacterium]